MAKTKINKNIQIPDNVLKSLITPSEWRMLKNRWQIVSLLKQGLSIRNIAGQVKVGTDTVVRTIRLVEKSNDFSNLEVGKVEKRILSQTPWIFGKNN